MRLDTLLILEGDTHGPTSGPLHILFFYLTHLPQTFRCQLLPAIQASAQISHPQRPPRPPYLMYLCPNPHTLSHCLVLFSSTYRFLKLSYLCIRLFTNCLPPNFNEGRGLVSSVPGMSLVCTAALNKHLMNEVNEGSWAQSPPSFFKEGNQGQGTSPLWAWVSSM